MTAPAHVAPGEVEQVFDYELEEHAGDGETCTRHDKPATHVIRHSGCCVYACAPCAAGTERTRVAALALGKRLTCTHCNAHKLEPDMIAVTPL